MCMTNPVGAENERLLQQLLQQLEQQNTSGSNDLGDYQSYQQPTSRPAYQDNYTPVGVWTSDLGGPQEHQTLKCHSYVSLDAIPNKSVEKIIFSRSTYDTKLTYDFDKGGLTERMVKKPDYESFENAVVTFSDLSSSSLQGKLKINDTSEGVIKVIKFEGRYITTINREPYDVKMSIENGKIIGISLKLPYALRKEIVKTKKCCCYALCSEEQEEIEKWKTLHKAFLVDLGSALPPTQISMDESIESRVRSAWLSGGSW